MTTSFKLPRVLLASALLMGVLGTGSAYAGDSGRHQARMEHRIEHLSTELALTDVQIEQVRAMFERVQEQFPRGPRRAGDGERLSDDEREALRAERRAKRGAMHELVQAEMTNILTPEQFQQFEALRAERMARRKGKHDGRHERGGAL